MRYKRPLLSLKRSCVGPLLVTALLLAALPINLSAAEKQKPNILYITIDDMNDWVGCLDGHPQVKTPNIDRLAKRGLLFTNAHCVVPACSGSRAANWTGLLPIHNGVYGNGQKLESTMPDAQLLPLDLQAQGYYTMGTGKLLHGKSNRMLDESGPVYNKWRPILDEELKISKAELNAGGPYVKHEIPRLGITMPLNEMPRDRKRGSSTIDSFDWGVIDRPESEWTDTQSADWAVEKLGQTYDKPFMLGVGFYRPHQPLWAPKKYHDMYPPESIILPEVPDGDLDDVSQTAQDLGRYALTSGAHDTTVENGQWRNAVSAYLACISFVDAQLGKVLDALDASEHANNTMIVLWTDHGWQLGEKEHWGKFTAWERSTRVPLILIPPKNARPTGFKPNRRSHKPVSLLDVYPTVIDVLGLVKRDDLDGHSLLPLLSDPKAEWKHLSMSTVGRGTHTVRHSRWRYTRYFDGSQELYDHKNDPNEWTNLVDDPEHANLVRWLSKQIPEDKTYSNFVRYSDFKAVIPSDGSPLMLYGPKVDMFAEAKDVSKKYPKIASHIKAYLSKNPNAPKHLNLDTL
ncbi:MAG: arylsulfatase A-like enzyme [Candidatus Pelagisphaera sp.]|jgi:arylsulfatase A-like enzyme